MKPIACPDRTARERARLAALDDDVTRLRGQYDVLMNGFKFDEARALVPAIEAKERERAALAAAMPEAPAVPPAPFAVARPRRRRR